MTMTESTDETEKIDLQMRQLALVDRIIGLEAQVAALKAGLSTDALKKQVEEFTTSATWRVGRLVLSPYLIARRAFGADKDK